jgi:Protein of unknown function (DUF3551)
MKMLRTMAVASALIFSAFVIVAMTSSPARADTYSAASNYCVQYGDNVTQCGFANLNQCQQTASGLNGECYPDLSRMSSSFAYAPRMHGRRR